MKLRVPAAILLFLLTVSTAVACNSTESKPAAVPTVEEALQAGVDAPPGDTIQPAAEADRNTVGSPTPTPIRPLNIPANATRARVMRVLDGNTVEVENGRKVRYIGVATPETVSPVKPVGCFGYEASDFNKLLVEGKTVFLEKDVNDTDRYRNLLRYVYLEDGRMVNTILVTEGYAQSSTNPPDVRYQRLFVEAEREARGANLGLWGSCKAPAPLPISIQNSGAPENRANCNAIRGTEYRSVVERQFYLANCVTASPARTR